MAVGLRLRQYVFRRDEFRCVYCGAEPDRFTLQADHVVPRARGGKTHPANLVTACTPCNRRKSDKDVPLAELPMAVLARLAAESRFRWADLRDVRP